METVIVKGKVVNWPPGCSCCRAPTDSSRVVEQKYELGDNHAPVETIRTWTSHINIPVCPNCQKHMDKAEWDSLKYWAKYTLTVGVPIALYILGMFYF